MSLDTDISNPILKQYILLILINDYPVKHPHGKCHLINIHVLTENLIKISNCVRFKKFCPDMYVTVESPIWYNFQIVVVKSTTDIYKDILHTKIVVLW